MKKPRFRLSLDTLHQTLEASHNLPVTEKFIISSFLSGVFQGFPFLKDDLLFRIVSDNFVDLLISSLSFLNFSYATFHSEKRFRIKYNDFSLKVAPVLRFLIRISLQSKRFSLSFTYVASCLTHCKEYSSSFLIPNICQRRLV